MNQLKMGINEPGRFERLFNNENGESGSPEMGNNFIILATSQSLSKHEAQDSYYYHQQAHPQQQYQQFGKLKKLKSSATCCNE